MLNANCEHHIENLFFKALFLMSNRERISAFVYDKIKLSDHVPFDIYFFYDQLYLIYRRSLKSLLLWCRILKIMEKRNQNLIAY